MAHVLANELKATILHAAMSGRLTARNVNDTPVYDTLKEIKQDRDNRVLKKEIKKDKRLCDKVISDGRFDIPDTWKWTTLGAILYKLTDGTHRTPKYTTEGVKFVSVKDMSSGVLSLENTKFISESEHKELFARCNPQKGDIILSKVGTTGVPAIVDTDEPFSLFVSVALLKFNDALVNRQFLYRLIMSPDIQQQAAENTRGIGNKNWVLDEIAKTEIPLPPIEEQARIVARVDELMAKIDEYEKLENELVELKKNFSGDMKAAVLQAAMQGKLTEQLKEDSKVKALETLARILPKYKVPENNEYDLPESWQCVKIADVMKIVNGFTPLRSNTSFWNSKDIPWFTIDDIRTQGRFINSTNQYISNEAVGKSSKRILPKDSILLCCTASVGEYAYSNIELTTNQQFNGLVRKPEFVNMIEPMYVYYFVQTLKTKLLDNSGSTTFSFLSTKKLGEFLLPLPPIEEQKRIVEKLDKILPLCEYLEKEIA